MTVYPHNRFDADVIIFGGEPIGLAAVCALAHYGVDCILLKQRLLLPT